MDTVYSSLLDAVGTDFLTEARRIGCQGLREICFVDDRIDELTDHGMLGCTDQVEVFALDLIHHVLHLGKTHNARNDGRTDHERRHVICEAAVDHKISCIGKDRRVKSRDIALEVIESVTAGLSCGIQIDTVEGLHDVHMIRNFEIRNDRLAETLVFDVFTVILTDRYGIVDDVREHEHDLSDLLGQFLLLDVESCHLVSHGSDLLLGFLGLILLSLAHQSTDLLTDRVSL